MHFRRRPAPLQAPTFAARFAPASLAPSLVRSPPFVVDLFEEVEEQLRSDRYRELARRIAPWATAIFAQVLIGYLGVWGYKAYQDRNLSTAALA